MSETGIGLIAASHGNLAEALVQTAEDVLGRSCKIMPFSFPPDETPKKSLARLRELVKKQDQGRGVMILADLFGGTPGTMALSMLEEKSVEVVTGMNLPMVLIAASLEPDVGLSKAAEKLVQASRKSIRRAGELVGN